MGVRQALPLVEGDAQERIESRVGHSWGEKKQRTVDDVSMIELLGSSRVDMAGVGSWELGFGSVGVWVGVCEVRERSQGCEMGAQRKFTGTEQRVLPTVSSPFESERCGAERCAQGRVTWAVEQLAAPSAADILAGGPAARLRVSAWNVSQTR